MVHEVLNRRGVALSTLTTRPAVDPHHRGSRIVCRGFAGLVQNTGNLQSVVAGEPNNFSLDHEVAIDRWIQRLGQLYCIATQGHVVQIIRRSVAVQPEGNRRLVAVKADLSKIAIRDIFQHNGIARGQIGQRNVRTRVVVYATHTVPSAWGVADIHHIPVVGDKHLALTRLQG